MKVRISPMIIVLILLMSGYALAARKTVAVMNFANYGGRGMKYLSNAVPESVSTALSEDKNVRVVERRQLGRILNEITLEQTGVIDTEDVTKFGRISRANILMLGSISGNPGNIVITMKAVEVKTGKILTGRVIQGELSTIFEKTNRAALSMAAIISGTGVGKISISTIPSSSNVYIDGLLVGKSPIVEYKVVKGDHRVKATRDGYIDYESTVSVNAGEHEEINTRMPESTLLNRTDIGFGAMYMKLLLGDAEGAPYYFMNIGHTFEIVRLSAELGFSFPDHNMDLEGPFGDFTQERWYNMIMLQGGVSIVPFQKFRYISPYAGINVGYLKIIDYKKNERLEDDKEELYNGDHVAISAILGTTFLPYAAISLFAETRFTYQPQKVTRYEYENAGIGSEMIKVEEKYTLMHWTIGGGIKYYF